MNAQVQSVVHAIQSHGFTPTGLKDALLRVGDAPASAEAKARITVILNGLCNLPTREAGILLSAAVKSAKGTSQEGPVKVRASEARQVYGAVMAVGEFREEAEGLGWSGAVQKAREVLNGLGIKWNGSKILSREEKQASAEANAIARTLAEKVVKEGLNPHDAEQMAAAVGEVPEQIMAEKASKMAKAIFEKQGADYCTMLINALMELIPGEVQEEPEVE